MKRVLVGLMVLLIAVHSAWAGYPEKPIELIVPSPPGGGTDIAVRLLAELTEPFLKQKLVVVNKPGGGGTLGVSLLTQAKPDGYTLGGVWNSPFDRQPPHAAGALHAGRLSAHTADLIRRLCALRRSGVSGQQRPRADR